MGKQRVIVNVSDAKASSNPSDVLITYSLGSCIAVCLYDQSAQIGGMLHYQLPDSKMDVDRAKKRPFMFADTGVKILIDQLVRLGANKKRMQVKIAGGAAIANGPVGFDIGKRNQLVSRMVRMASTPSRAKL